MATSPLDTLCDFIGAALHLILYVRRVYPAEIFERRRHLDVTVFRSRHIELNDHIDLVVSGLRRLLERGEADALVVSITGRGARILERFRFDLHITSSRVDLEVLRVKLRSFLLKIHVCETLLLPLNDADIGFSVELHTTPTKTGQPLSESLLEQWVDCDLQRELGALQGGSDLVPLKSLSVNGLSLGLCVLVGSRGPAAARTTAG